MNPFWFKAVLLLSVLGRIAKSKQRKDMNFFRQSQQNSYFFHIFFIWCNAEPYAAKTKRIRFQPDIFLGDRHVDLRHVLHNQSLFPIYRNDHNRRTCRTSLESPNGTSAEDYPSGDFSRCTTSAPH